jgi:hypothetical protein
MPAESVGGPGLTQISHRGADFDACAHAASDCSLLAYDAAAISSSASRKCSQSDSLRKGQLPRS